MSLPSAPTWRALRGEVEARLAATVGDRAPVEARWMVLEASGLSEAELLVDEDELVPALTQRRIDAMLERRAQGVPLQYVLGSWSFRGIDLMVDERVLIPRPETEVVAQVAIEELAGRGARRGRHDPWGAGVAEYEVADLGTGSGALALALAAELPGTAVWATDVDERALAVARANLSSIGSAATRVRLVQGDWFDALPVDLRGRLSLVVSNPPYVSDAEFGALPAEVAEHEPAHALVSGPTGLEHVERIVATATEWLEPGGALVLEIAPHQATSAIAEARAAGFVDAEARDDLTGRPRVLVAHIPDSS